ncbi:hypothetical protein Prum_010630 [Phytohabitans rumicis]|uniref:Uncharacterized protein n=1 Tax=Phytohabitans rumicis TaxID=1076125 RepID=A0A6V8KYA1_9ACTN|nr:hypothetical protein Prum_010630 [Phytohabitans rumicis]
MRRVCVRQAYPDRHPAGADPNHLADRWFANPFSDQFGAALGRWGVAVQATAYAVEPEQAVVPAHANRAATVRDDRDRGSVRVTLSPSVRWRFR